jgi:GT2 family glycosyltransferase/glycosyltransferase involved in cell wall biosynthesis
LARCVEELLDNTQYLDIELIIVDQNSEVEDLDDIYDDARQKLEDRFILLSYDEPNYSAMINYGVSHASGSFVVVLSNTVMTVNGNWLTEMLAQVQQDDVGVVGARTLDEDNHVVHAGGILGVTDDVTGMFSTKPITESGYMNRAHVVQEYATVSSGCFMVSVEHFKQAGGLDEKLLANSRYCITDFCLKVKSLGLRNIWTPHATVGQDRATAKITNGVCDEYVENNAVEKVILDRWANECSNDTSFNRNLSLKTTDFSVELDMLLGWDHRFKDRPRVMASPLNSLGVGEYRVRAPLRALAHEAMIEATLLSNSEFRTDRYTPTRFEMNRARPDILLLHHALSDQDYEFIKRVKSETNIKLIFGIDDRVDQVPDKNARKKLVFRDMKHRLRRTMQLCDRMIVSTQPLADAYQAYCDNIVVVPNMIELLRWNDVIQSPVAARNNIGNPRFGWAGANQHHGDLEIITDVIKETASEIDWILFGLCPDELRPYVKEIHEFVSFDKYPEKLSQLQLDVAVAPLEFNAFNESKSNLKLLEYGVMGWPVICTDIYPYQENSPPVMRVKNDKQAWLDAINTAVNNLDEVHQQGRALKQWVFDNYLLEENLNQWMDALTL